MRLGLRMPLNEQGKPPLASPLYLYLYGITGRLLAITFVVLVIACKVERMNTWAPLWSGIVDSSLWEESGDVVKVFMTILATKDSDHICRLDAYKIARKCALDELAVLDILKVLAGPDKRRKGKQLHDGRRIKMVEDGFLVLNGEVYRKKVSEEMRKARLRRAQNTFRQKQKSLPAVDEMRAAKAYDNGDVAKGDAIAAKEA